MIHTSGGDPNIPNNDGTLPVQLATSFGEDHVMRSFIIIVIVGHYDVAKLLTQ